MIKFLIGALLALALCNAAPHKYYHHYKNYHRPHYYYRPAAVTYHYSHGSPHKTYMSHHGKMAKDEAVATKAAAPGDVVDVAVGAGSFTTLVKIVSDLGLVDTLKGAEALTVFAPSDEAFAKLPAGTLESLSPEDAKAIILRHVVTAKVPAAAVATGPVETIGGEVIDLVKTDAGGVQINYKGNTVNVVAADVMARYVIINFFSMILT